MKFDVYLTNPETFLKYRSVDSFYLITPGRGVPDEWVKVSEIDLDIDIDESLLSDVINAASRGIDKEIAEFQAKINCLIERKNDLLALPSPNRPDIDQPYCESWKEIWEKENDAGNGFAVGDESDHINEIRGFGKLIVRAESDTDVAVYQLGSVTTIVADSAGPWAVRM